MTKCSWNHPASSRPRRTRFSPYWNYVLLGTKGIGEAELLLNLDILWSRKRTRLSHPRLWFVWWWPPCSNCWGAADPCGSPHIGTNGTSPLETILAVSNTVSGGGVPPSVSFRRIEIQKLLSLARHSTIAGIFFTWIDWERGLRRIPQRCVIIPNAQSILIHTWEW